MLEAVALDSRSVLIKAETEKDMLDIIAFVSHRDKLNAVNKLFTLGRENLVIDDGYSFNRDELYER